MKEKDRLVLSRAIKYVACVLAVVFMVRGFVKKFFLQKADFPQITSPQSTDEKIEERSEENQSEKNWVDQVMESPDEIFEIPESQMSEAKVQDQKSAEEIFDQINVSSKRKKFLDCAKNYLGVPYVYGGADKSGMDCSGLVYQSAKDAKLGTLPKSSRGLFEKTVAVEKNKALPGDLVFFERDGSIFHVAIYLGENKIIHSISDTHTPGVDVSDLSEKFWSDHLKGFGKIAGIDD